MCLTETYSRVRVGKNTCMSDMFPIRNGLKQGDDLSSLLFNFALGYAIRRVQVNHDRTVILPVVLYGCETWSLILMEGT
jgi:hypothetical protein